MRSPVSPQWPLDRQDSGGADEIEIVVETSR